MCDAVGVLLLAAAAMLLNLRVLGEIVEAGEFGLVEVRVERLSVDGDEAGDVTVFGLDDELGGVVALVGAVEEILEGMVILFLVETALDGAANQCGSVDGCWGSVLAGGRGCEGGRKQEQ
jgi:hypothetical protein